jgi:hypothetical protein
MTATRKMIRDLRKHSRMRINPALEALILRHFGTEPDPHTYTEQDLYEQIRKLVERFNKCFPSTSYEPDLPALPTRSDADCSNEADETDTQGGAYGVEI